MSEIKISKIKVDNEELKLCTEWSDSGCSILLFGKEQILKGKLTNELIEKFASRQSKSKEVYIEETKRNFMLNNEKIQFTMNNNHFKWKKSFWNLGNLELQPILTVDAILEFLNKFITNFEHLQKNMTNASTSNTELLAYQENMDKKIEEMIKMKDNMEKELYKRFLLILNSKKKKIQEIKSELDRKDSQNAAYDTQTDDSQDLMNSNKLKIRRKVSPKHIFKRRRRVYSESEDSQEIQESKKEEDDRKEQNDDTFCEEDIEEKSASKNNFNGSQEITLKLTDESAESLESPSKRTKVFEPDSDEDLFL